MDDINLKAKIMATLRGDMMLASRAVHHIIGIGTESAVGNCLREMADAGEIERENRKIGGDNTITMYRRKVAPDAGA